MKYKDFIFINNNFHPVFDLENETEDNKWSVFIPNDIFRGTLSSVIDSLTYQNKNSVWLHGRYGTGKSHATAVIKHLLCDKEKYNYNLEDNKLTAKLNNFRKDNNVLPIVLKGTSTINSPKEFRATIQVAVKKTLENKGLDINISSDFDHMIKLVKDNHFTDNDFQNSSLAAYPEDEIIKRLENNDTAIFISLNEILLKKDLFLFNKMEIVDWLSEVRDKLKEKYDIDYLMIFWDEFTGALRKSNSDEILLDIQNIAEAKNKGIALFIVTHKVQSDRNYDNDHVKKVMDRFEQKHYRMETIATYDLMEKSIKKDEDTWAEIKDRHISTINSLIDIIVKDEDYSIRKAIENLYPIHPYTAYLATLIVEHIGSAERSIFKFLHDDDENGFKQFINDYDVDDKYFLTSEYLWDFFYDDFDESEDEKVRGAINKFKAHEKTFIKLNDEYMVIFKVILLLNILFKIASVEKSSLVTPSRENIKNVFIGSIYQDKVDDVLNYINENIITETPDNLFEITSSILPDDEVDEEVKILRNSYSNMTKILKPKLKEIKDFINSKTIRDAEIHILDASLNESSIMSKLEKGLFKKKGRLHILFFLYNDNNELIKLRSNIKKFTQKEFLKNILFIISETNFVEEDITNYFKYKANENIANKHNLSDALVYNKYTEDYMDKWIQQIKDSLVSWYLGDENGEEGLKSFHKKINSDLSKKIFYKGLENIDEITDNINIWNVSQTNNAIIKNCIASKNFSDLKDIFVQNKGLPSDSLNIFKNNNGEEIVNDNFSIKDNISVKHPLKLIQDFVDGSLSEKQSGGVFNIGDTLEELSNPPYGLYRNAVNTVALCFVLRKYLNQFYFNSVSVETDKMRDIVDDLFNYWEKGKGKEKLNIRYGSEIEKKFIDLIGSVFDFNLVSEEKSIDKIRWKVREWMKLNKSPLWLFKYSDNVNDLLINAINSLYEVINSNNVTDESIEKCFNEISNDDLEFDFFTILKEDSDVLFKNFINTFATKADSNFSQENIPRIRDFIIKTMPEINDNWDESKVQNKCYEEIIRIRNENELQDKVDKLISVVSKIFNFNCEEKTIESIGLNIEKWVTSNKIPLWLFKYSNNVKGNAINEAINILISLIENRNIISFEAINKSYGKIYATKEDLSLLIKEDFDDLLSNFILIIDPSLFSNDILKVKSKLMESLTVGFYSLKESEIKEKIQKIIHEIKLDPSKSEIEPEIDETIIDKVSKSDADIVKKAIINMLKDNKEIQEQFKKYLEGV